MMCADDAPNGMYPLWRETLDDLLAHPETPDAHCISWWLLKICLRNGWPCPQAELDWLESVAALPTKAETG